MSSFDREVITSPKGDSLEVALDVLSNLSADIAALRPKDFPLASPLEGAGFGWALVGVRQIFDEHFQILRDAFDSAVSSSERVEA